MAATDHGITTHTVTEIYSSWVNSCLQSKVSNLKEDLKDGTILCQLIEITTGSRLLSTDDEKEEDNSNNLSKAINFIKEKSIEVNDDCIEDISQGDLKAILDLLWLIILNFDIHNHNRAAYQRSVSMGKRFLMEWISRELPDVIVDTKGNFVQSFQNGFLLSRMITKYCEFKSDDNEQPKKPIDGENIQEYLDAAESQLGVPNSILSQEVLHSGKIDEYTLLIYLAILRRKVCEKNGEEVFKGGGSPIKNPTPQSTPIKTTPKKPQPGLNGQSPLSPATLKKLVDQQTKSHEAIQALQAKLQAINYHPFSPKLLKSLPRTGAPGMPPIFGLSCEQGRRHSHPGVIDYNEDQKSPDIEEIYDRSFFHSMLDAVQDYMLPKTAANKEKVSAENEKNSLEVETTNGEESEEAKEVSLTRLEESSKSKEFDEKSSEVIEMPEKRLEEISKPEQPNEIGKDTFIKVDESSRLEETGESVRCEKPQGEYSPTNYDVINGDTEENVINSEINEPTTAPVVNNINKNTAEGTTPDENTIETTGELDVNPSKRVQFSGLDTVFAKTKDFKSPNSTVSETISPNTSSSPKDLSFCEDVEEKVPMDGCSALKKNDSRIETVTWGSLSSSLAELDDMDYEPTNSSVLFDDENDQFMMYLNSIEQTALKFKLQVEQAKIDTLQILKKRLEQAYEGTPLEEIPAKVHEKLQETIAQIATEEVKKYESVLNADIEDEFDQDECGILQQMRVELDALSAENCRLNQQLEDMKKYETEYYELQKKIEGMEDGLTSMKHDYATKNGESEFLGKRIEALEQEMISMRVEYEEQIRELQNQNIDLQKECFEFDSENQALEDEIRRFQIGLTDNATHEEISQIQEDDYLAERITAAELEALEIRVNELERHNKALKAAGEADHAVVVCLEKKVEELEGNLNEAKSANSDLLTELHESQRQQASDRAKLTSYKEELEALKRENRVLKNSLESAENEVQYQKRKNENVKKTNSLTRSPPSLGNKREIWNEIRELENILKDVQKEKVTIEKKYHAFRRDSTDLPSSVYNTPRSSTLNISSPSVNSPVSTCRTSPESTLSRPRKTTSLLERVNSLLEKSSLQNGTTLPHPTKSPTTSSLKEDDEKSVGTTPRGGKENSTGDSNELVSLRSHVGSLEAEKASILRELSHLRTPKKDESSC